MATAQQIFEERIRTVEQVKRLYAVVMGFAVTTCFANIYGCARIIGHGDTYGLSILTAQGIAFVSLIVLFYLGTERLFESRYLSPDSKVPTRRGLLMDLTLGGVTASYFVVLSNTFPDPAATNNGSLALLLHVFVRNLLILYAMDGAFVACQLVRILRERPDNLAEARTAHLVWLGLNIASFALLLFVFPIWEAATIDIPGLALSAGAVFVGLLHIVRFLADFGYTFKFYYPVEPLRWHARAEGA